MHSTRTLVFLLDCPEAFHQQIEELLSQLCDILPKVLSQAPLDCALLRLPRICFAGNDRIKCSTVLCGVDEKFWYRTVNKRHLEAFEV